VLATTAPLYGLMIAVVSSVARGIPPGYLLGALSVAAFAGSAVLLADLASDLGCRATLLLLIAFACYLAFVDNTTTGMETPVFILGMAASLWLVRREHTGWASLTSGLLVLVRPEGLVWALALATAACLARRRPSLKCLMPGLAVAAAWVALAVPFYGSAIPHSVLSKSGWLVPFSEQPVLAHCLRTFASLALLDPPPAMGDGRVATVLLHMASAGSAGLFCTGTVLLLRRRRLAVSLPLLFCGYLVLYLAAKGRVDFSWYGIPSGLAYWATCSVGLAAVVRLVVRVRLRETLMRIALPLLAAMLTVVTLWCWRAVRLPYYRLIGSSYEAAGTLINATAPADARVLIDEAGMLGYASRRHAVDLDGIVAPEVLGMRRAAGWWCPLGDVVRAVDPDFIAVSWTHANRLFGEDGGAWIGDHYDTLGTFPGHVVFRRTDVSSSARQGAAS
jgi:hypothetical protein